MRSWIVILIAMLWIWPLAGSAPAEGPNQTNPPAQSSAPAPASGQPDAFFPQANHTFEAVLEGAVVMHSFVLKNRGDAVLDVKEVKTS